MVNGNISKPCDVVSGVPQGSVIGPLLFLVLIGDIDSKVIYTFISSFADDTRTAKEVNNVREASELQTDLEAIY